MEEMEDEGESDESDIEDDLSKDSNDIDYSQLIPKQDQNIEQDEEEDEEE